jgi:hypothetical protein
MSLEEGTMKSNKTWHSMAAIVGIALGIMLSTRPAAADTSSSNKTDKGAIRKLSAEWWQWALSIPAPVNPLSFNDSSGDSYCGVGQHGPVWFLGGNFNGLPAERSCTIPAGTAIFLPIITAECSAIEGNGTTEEEFSACAKDLIDHVTTVEASLDGVALKNLTNSRVQSPLFSFTLPPDDVFRLFGKEPNPSPSVSDGFWILLKSLSPGAHTIEVHGVAFFPPASTFEQKIVYHVTVVPALP